MPIALKQPTNPDSANESSASSTHLDSTLAPPSHGLPANLSLAAAAAGAGTSNGALTPSAAGSTIGGGSMMGGSTGLNNYDTSNNYDFWDPQHWMLDGLIDFNFNSFVPIESA
jgi:hypothetical protein